MNEVDKIKNWWSKISSAKGTRYTLLALGAFWLGLLILLSHRVPGWCLIGTVLLAVSIFFHKSSWSYIVFMAAVFFYMFSTPITMVGLVLIGIYLLYKLLNSRRINRIRRIANMSPGELSKVKYDKPQVEIIIHGGKR